MSAKLAPAEIQTPQYDEMQLQFSLRIPSIVVKRIITKNTIIHS